MKYFFLIIIAFFLDFSLVEQVRQQIPIFSQRRIDLYNTIKNCK